MTINLAFIDFFQGFDPENNLIKHSIEYTLGKSKIVDDYGRADIIFFSIFGGFRNDPRVAPLLNERGILWLGENIRPNFATCRYSITCDFEPYSGKNFRLPLWMHEIDWFNTGLGVTTLEEVYTKLVKKASYSEADLMSKKFCVAIFNNLEGTRVEMYRQLNNISPITSYGKPFGNWFCTSESYRAKINHLEGHLFNMCPENSFNPGYYTEKCFHAKLASCIPIYMADHHVYRDFRKGSLVNLYDFLFIETMVEEIVFLLSNRDRLLEIACTPLLHKMPTLNSFFKFIYKISNKILLQA